MEDQVCIVDGYLGSKQNGFFAIYDGHGGRDVSLYLQKKLHENIAKEIEMNDGRSVEECIDAGYVITDAECCALFNGSVGATAVTAIVIQQGNDRKLYVSNVGDSRAVLCQSGKAVRLSKDHKTSCRDEQKRIYQQGGFILHQRVSGVLAVSRSFGDRELKESVIARPNTTMISIDSLDECPFIVLACDGVWDELSDEEVIEIVRLLPVNARPLAAKVVVDNSKARQSCDNLSSIVVFF